jgi:hypothetical protein
VKLDKNAKQKQYLLEEWSNWSKMQYSEKIRRNKNTHKNNKAKLRPALYVRTSEGKNLQNF